MQSIVNEDKKITDVELARSVNPSKAKSYQDEPKTDMLPVTDTNITDEVSSTNNVHAINVVPRRCNDGQNSEDISKENVSNNSDEEDSTFESADNPQPRWFLNLDEVSRYSVRNICEQTGLPPSDVGIKKLRSLFNIELEQALEVNELYHTGKLQGPLSPRLKSILRDTTGSAPESNRSSGLKMRISWLDESGKSLTQTFEMKSWHNMDSSKRLECNTCCLIL